MPTFIKVSKAFQEVPVNKTETVLVMREQNNEHFI